MKKIFNTPNMLMLGIAVATVGLLYLGLIWHCSDKRCNLADNNDFTTEISIPS